MVLKAVEVKEAVEVVKTLSEVIDVLKSVSVADVTGIVEAVDCEAVLD